MVGVEYGAVQSGDNSGAALFAKPGEREAGHDGQTEHGAAALGTFIDNVRVDIRLSCQAWSRWLIGQVSEGRVILLVDETSLGQHLSVMMMGLAYHGCCIALAWWCYHEEAWPMKQVDLIHELLTRVAAGVPVGCIPLVQADRGIGCSPALVHVVRALGWHFLFRVQKSTRFRHSSGPAAPPG